MNRSSLAQRLLPLRLLHLRLLPLSLLTLRLLPHKLPARLVVLLASLLLGWGLLVGLLASRVAADNEHEALQRLSYGLADHIVQHWPELGGGTPDDPAPRQELLRMLMTVNPGIQVYLLDPAGRVQSYIGEPGMVRQPQVDTRALRAFLAGAPLPLYGTDPMGGAAQRLFSAAMFSPRRRWPGRLSVHRAGRS